jgi:ankyrin repeat protein
LYAAGRGYKAIVKLLLETQKVDIDSEDKNKWTPLLWAAWNGHATVELLLEKGAEKEIRSMMAGRRCRRLWETDAATSSSCCCSSKAPSQRLGMIELVGYGLRAIFGVKRITT